MPMVTTARPTARNEKGFLRFPQRQHLRLLLETPPGFNPEADEEAEMSKAKMRSLGKERSPDVGEEGIRKGKQDPEKEKTGSAVS